jgi:hypothetical protein
MDKRALNVLCAEINARCWDDERFKARFIAEPQKVFEEYEIPYNPDMEYHVLEASKDEGILVLPAKGGQEVLSKVMESMTNIPNSAPVLPDGRKLVIVQNTDKVTYLVISDIKDVSTKADMSGMPVDVMGGTAVLNFFVAANVCVVSDAAVATEAGVAAIAVALAI